MKQIITHVTHYRYTAPVNYSIQTLRLTPRDDEHQRVLRWNIEAPGDLEKQVDAYGNITHTLTLNRPHSDIELRVTGQVLVAPLTRGVLGGEDSRLPVHAYCVQTPLTQADDTILAFVRDVLPQGMTSSDDILALAAAIHERVAYEPGTTDVTTAADQVLAMGHGVCQDHAHLFLACVRGMNVPARYVSGYLYTTAEHAASHAWVDVWLSGIGWTSVDITNRQFASECHCRLAVGRDYDSASPVRGVRSGGGDETMEISVQVQEAVQQ
ncbi:transglutaminase family protein [Achromobacter arsenitoxydans]|uniref:Transglutaminase-like superfamily protein n=1 Tax=Achromobacter arsenitoxydans SY8 TaxID=477184 RepID=H0FB65_9BURK|nr:transglutaminase family protein [Achromobacter arsenitoxydans]EHK64498.1 transglutaminase-like superfamily protein [Achromobacter arsenitoxydans SY8]